MHNLFSVKLVIRLFLELLKVMVNFMYQVGHECQTIQLSIILGVSMRVLWGEVNI
jgi:hypothetical protein